MCIFGNEGKEEGKFEFLVVYEKGVFFVLESRLTI